ncbi:MAG: LysM peptidoglycan-binding domain-containing protein [Nevskiaceae bacterium]|nr:MAG: LysM peptidoglycan-binding domain-containing protein [Nevskiaceae bacterium]TBR71337.1 MAG: LysM peptidoglycan-binding domain-containing protein [Nevskiaceae bacterium]
MQQPWVTGLALTLGACALSGCAAAHPAVASTPAAEGVEPMPVAATAAPATTSSTRDATGALQIAAHRTPSGASGPALDPRLFPQPAILQDNVQFWTDIFGKYSLQDSVVHSTRAMGRPIQVMTFSDATSNTLRNSQEKQAIADTERALDEIVAANAQVDRLSPDARRVYIALGAGNAARFKALQGTIRVQRGQRDRTLTGLETAGRYLPTMRRIFKNYGLPEALTRLPIVESSFNVLAYSKVGAAGIWQFMPSTARLYMKLNAIQDDRRDPWTSTDAAARMLRDNYAMLGSWPLAITAYNYGPGGIRKALAETGGTDLADLIARYDNPRFGFASSNFYAEFLAANIVANHPERYFGTLDHETPIEFDVVTTTDYVPYTTLQRISGADSEQFAQLNPSFSAAVLSGKLHTPPGTRIRVPTGQQARFTRLYAALGPEQRASQQRVWYVAYRVRRGDTLASIARHHGTSTQDLMRMNGIRNARSLRTGQQLRIPNRGAPRLVATALHTTHKAHTRTVHRVTRGQTLSAIAARHNVSVSELRIANNLRDADSLQVGMLLKIP